MPKSPSPSIAEAEGGCAGLGSQEPLGEVFAFTTVCLEQGGSRWLCRVDIWWVLGHWSQFWGSVLLVVYGLTAASTPMGLYSSLCNFVSGDKEAGGESEDPEQSQSREGRTGHSLWTGLSSPFPWSPSERFLFSSQNLSLRMNACYPSTEEPGTGGS